MMNFPFLLVEKQLCNTKTLYFTIANVLRFSLGGLLHWSLRVTNAISSTQAVPLFVYPFAMPFNKMTSQWHND